MLYVATALPSTAVTHSINVPNLTSLAPGASSLVVAKGNTIEVWDLKPEGLVEVCKTDVWGMVVGLEWVGKTGQKPHIVVQTDHPLSRILLYRVVTHGTPALDLTASQWVDRRSRTAEFFTGLLADRANGVVVASLYVGMLSVIEIGVKEKEDEIGKGGRRASTVGKGKKRERKDTGESMMDVDDESLQGDVLDIKEIYEINIREHNLLSLAFTTVPQAAATPRPASTLVFLYLTPDYTINMVARSLDRSARSFTGLVDTIDILSPPALTASSSSGSAKDFSVPAAKRLLAVPDGVLVVGDEFSATYRLTRSSRRRTSSTAKPLVSPKVELSESALSTSPDNSKRRKSSIGGTYHQGMAGKDGEEVLSWAKGWRIRQGFGEVSGVTNIHTEGREVVLLGDAAGRLTAISYTARDGPAKPIVRNLGIISPPTCITYLDNGHVFVGSQCGDSQVLRLIPDSVSQGKGKRKATNLMQIEEENGESAVDAADSERQGFVPVAAWPNIGPVLDFCLVEGEGGGAAQVVTASGLASSGSLRVVRSGVGSEVIAKVEGLPELVSITSFNIGTNVGLLLSTQESSMLIRVVEQTDCKDTHLDIEAISPDDVPYEANARTITARQVSGDKLVQVTTSGVQIIDPIGARVLAAWVDLLPEETVLVASCSETHVIVGLSSGDTVLLSFTLEASDAIIQLNKRIKLGLGEIASVALADDNDGRTVLCAIGFWGSNLVVLASSTDLAILEQITEASLPRSIVLRRDSEASSADGSDGLLMLIGQGDGTVTTRTISFVKRTGPGIAMKITIGDRNVMALGRTPVHLTMSPAQEGSPQILSLSDRVSIIYEEQERISRSPLNLNGITSAAMVRLPSTGPCLVLANSEGLQLRSVSSLKELQIRKVDMGFDNPQHIAHHPSARVFGVAITTTKIDQEFGDQESTGCFRLYDDQTFTPSSEIPLEQGEKPTSLGLIEVGTDGLSYFALGTTFENSPDDAGASNSGNLRLINVRTDDVSGRPAAAEVIAKHQLNGTVYDIKSIWGMLAVAVDHRVDLLQLRVETQPEIQVVSTWGNAFFASCLTVQTLDNGTKQRLHVGDGMRSVCVLERGSKGELVDVGRDMRPHWVLTMEELDADGGAVAFSDTNYNLLTIRHQNNKFENSAGLALHETVTRMCKGSLLPGQENPALRPELVFATSSGRLGVIADLSEPESKILRELQLNMENLVTGPEIPWSRYREIHAEGNAKPRPALGFIDGDFIKRFLSIPGDSELVSLILEGPNEFSKVHGSRAEVIQILDAVGSAHS